MDCFRKTKRCPRHEPDELRSSSPVLRGPWGEVPRGYSAMSRKGDCWDNAVVESFFSTLKRELFLDEAMTDRNSTGQAVFELSLIHI